MSTNDSQLPCRLIVEGADSGARQMAVDEVLLEGAAAGGGATLRFYQWIEPTLSLGYFQRYAERDAHAASRDCALVRRQTGGGAILHDRELTYSLVSPWAHPLATDATRLYDAVHQSLIRVLAEMGLNARQRAVQHTQPASAQPFLCFQRQTMGDVLLGETKICGSAQRRRRGAILQHGSLLLATSTAAPELPGILEVGGRALEAGELAERWGRKIAATIQLALSPGALSPAECTTASSLGREKYGAELWNRRR